MYLRPLTFRSLPSPPSVLGSQVPDRPDPDRGGPPATRLNSRNHPLRRTDHTGPRGPLSQTAERAQLHAACSRTNRKPSTRTRSGRHTNPTKDPGYRAGLVLALVVEWLRLGRRTLGRTSWARFEVGSRYRMRRAACQRSTVQRYICRGGNLRSPITFVPLPYRHYRTCFSGLGRSPDQPISRAIAEMEERCGEDADALGWSDRRIATGGKIAGEAVIHTQVLFA